MYHERQRLQFCALHVLNNLFQKKAFVKEELDDICYSLSPNATINPHKSMLGLGNYDVNVLTIALQLREYNFIWFDKRKNLEDLKLRHIFGFILNKFHSQSFMGIGIPIKQRHWIAIRSINDNYYNLDSKLNEPKCIGTDQNLISYLKSELVACEKTQLFVVVAESVSEGSWLKVDAEKQSEEG